MPGLPVAVVPLPDGADGQAIARVLSGVVPNSPLRLPASKTMRGAVVGGTPAAVARVRDAQPAARPELAAAMAAAGGGAAVRVIIMPSTTQRRAFEESLPNLPPMLGDLPITTITRDLSWATLAMALEPSPTLRASVQARDADAATKIQKVFQSALNLLVQSSQGNPATAGLARVLATLKPEARGEQITLEADLEKTAELVAVPIAQAREGARRSQCTNNLKQIGLAMHNFHSVNGTFPPAYTASKDGKPLLSWRVHILPYLEQKALYDEFHLDEPWDSPHNKALIPRMPAPYACPSGSRTLAREGKTSYLAPRGPATIFPGPQAVKLQDITDGTSNTILVVDAADALATTWTKPDDWEVAPDFKTQGLFGHHTRGTNFGFADGSVRFLKETVKAKLLQALTTRNGNEVISSDD
jgi:prepilin-type processing-associated H-X9-DG protein